MIDNNLIFSHEQAETTQTVHPSTNDIDTGAANSNIGWGEPLFLNFGIHTLVASATGTLTVTLEDSAAGTTFIIIVQSFPWIAATLVKGFLWTVGIPHYHSRFFRVVYTIGVAVLTAGKWNCWLGREQYRKLA